MGKSDNLKKLLYLALELKNLLNLRGKSEVTFVNINE
jgi:hypothetical protein